MTNKTRSIAISIAVSVLLIGFLFYGLNWELLLKNIKQVQLLPVLALLILYWLSLEIRAIRWRYLLPSKLTHKREHLRNCVAIGFFASAVLPLRAGEIIRPWLYAKRHPDLSFAASFASIVIERVFDTLIILALFAWVLASKKGIPEILLIGAYSLGMLAVVLVAVALVAYFKPSAVLALFKFVTSFITWRKTEKLLQAVGSILEEFLTGLRAISNSREFFISLLLTVILWLEIALMYQLGISAMGASGGFDLGITISVVVALAVAAPSAPGYIGTFQVGCVLALSTLYGFDREFALSYSIVMHGLQFVATLVIGIVALRREGVSFYDMVRRDK